MTGKSGHILLHWFLFFLVILLFHFFSVLRMFPTISLDFVVNYYKLMFVLIADCKLRQQESKTSRELTFPVDLRHFRII